MGLKIDFHKSSLVGLIVDNSFLSSASTLLGRMVDSLLVKVDSLPIKYLGILLSNKLRS